MTAAFQNLVHLLIHNPNHIGWLCAHAWEWHKTPIILLGFDMALVVWTVRQISRRH